MISANIYFKNDYLFVAPSATTDRGIGLVYFPIEKIMINNTCHDIGEAILRAFQNNVIGVPNDIKGSELLAPLFNAMGVRSWKAVTKGTKFMGVTLKNDTYLFWPTHNRGARNGFVPLNDLIIQLSAPLTPSEIGQKVLECLSFSIDDNGGL